MAELTKTVSCPVEVTLTVLGGKWKPLIVHHLLGGTKRFGQIRRLLPHVTQQMLTHQLRELEQVGVLSRHVYAQVPPRVEYSLTRLGKSLEPILQQMYVWGEWYSQHSDTLLEEAVGELATPKEEL